MPDACQSGLTSTCKGCRISCYASNEIQPAGSSGKQCTCFSHLAPAASVNLLVRTVDADAHFRVGHLRSFDVVLLRHLPSTFVQSNFHIRRPSAIGNDVVKRGAHVLPVYDLLTIAPYLHKAALVIRISAQHHSVSSIRALIVAGMDPDAYSG